MPEFNIFIVPPVDKKKSLLEEMLARKKEERQMELMEKMATELERIPKNGTHHVGGG